MLKRESKNVDHEGLLDAANSLQISAEIAHALWCVSPPFFAARRGSMPSQGVSPLLQQLAVVPVTELCRRAATGERPVQALYDLSTEHGLCSTTARDDVERLYSIFDLAVVHGMGSIVLDYVEAVCLDPFCSSRSSSGRPLRCSYAMCYELVLNQK